MSRSRLGRALLAVLFGAAVIGPGLGAAPADRVPTPDARLQPAIETALGAIARQDEDAGQRVDAIETLAEGGREELLLQLALALEGSTGTERSMAGALLLRRLAFSPDETIDAFVPRLDAAGPNLRRVMTEMLGTIDRREDGGVDFGAYGTWLRKRGGPPPVPLVRYLYDVSPGEARRFLRGLPGGTISPTGTDDAVEALEALRRGRDASRALTGEERDRAGRALETLAQSTAWWDRAYAAALLARDRDLGPADLARRLADDPDPLVRAARTATPPRPVSPQR